MPTDPARVQAVFTAAAEIADPASRALFLGEACGGDSGLRSRVDALLRAHDRPDSMLDAPLVSPPHGGPPTTRTFAPEHPATRTGGGMPGTAEGDEALSFLAPPTRPDSLGRIGHYEVLQVLGRGGFGIVFRAFDDILQRVVAVKVMAPQLAATSPARKRFLREARTSAAVRHENVVQVYEVAERPLPYLVMEFIPGETLQQMLGRTGPLDVAEVLRIGRQVAEGLAAAHATDLIHRDIKPGNVLIEGGPRRQVKITDFGLARAADDASISQSGIIAGTPMYMAPEQAKGETLDQRADLFSLGSVLYQMAAGRPPFRASSTAAVLKRVAEDTPRDIREVIPETPPWLCAIIAKLHAKNPADRYQSAREVADVLADCEAQLKSNSKLKDFSRIPRAKSLRAGRRTWIAAAVLAAAGVSLAGWRGWGSGSVTNGQAAAGASAPARRPPATPVTWGTVEDPLGDCRFAEEDGRLTVTVPGREKHDLNPRSWGSGMNAPRVFREVDGDFEARVTVLAGSDPRMTPPDAIPYVGAGLFVMQDDTHLVRNCRARLIGFPTHVHAHWFNGPGGIGERKSPPQVGPLQLRIRRVAGVIFVAYGTNGQAWSDEAATDFTMPGRVRVGVVVVSTVDQDYTAQFEGFILK
ncbi:MAG: protein kinase [Gemmataceae bacterium]